MYTTQQSVPPKRQLHLQNYMVFHIMTTRCKDVYKRTIEILQGPLILKADDCLKVHNAHFLFEALSLGCGGKW